jgi:hypothetical protein
VVVLRWIQCLLADDGDCWHRARSCVLGSFLLGNPLQRLPKPAKVPSIPMSAILSDGLLVPAQQGPDAATTTPRQRRVLVYLLEPGLEVGGTPQISRIDES